jgi:hypothetical protein
MFNKKLHRFQTIAFNFIVALSWILYISITLGLSFAAPQYLNYLNSFRIWAIYVKDLQPLLVWCVKQMRKID